MPPVFQLFLIVLAGLIAYGVITSISSARNQGREQAFSDLISQIDREFHSAHSELVGYINLDDRELARLEKDKAFIAFMALLKPRLFDARRLQSVFIQVTQGSSAIRESRILDSFISYGDKFLSRMEKLSKERV